MNRRFLDPEGLGQSKYGRSVVQWCPGFLLMIAKVNKHRQGIIRLEIFEVTCLDLPCIRSCSMNSFEDQKMKSLHELWGPRKQFQLFFQWVYQCHVLGDRSMLSICNRDDHLRPGLRYFIAVRPMTTFSQFSKA